MPRDDMSQNLGHVEYQGKCHFCGKPWTGFSIDECPKRRSAPIVEIPRKRSTFDDRCLHFAAMSENKQCHAAVTYEEVRVEHEPIQYKEHGTIYTASRSLPCFKSRNLKPEQCRCEKAQFPTPEECEAHHKKMHEGMERIGKAREAIVAHLGGPWRKGMSGAQGIIDCPACGSKGTLHFSRAGYNGHVHARCETNGCVSWME